MSSAYKAFALDTIEFMLSSLREQVTIISRMSEIKTITTGNIVGSMSVSDLRTGCENLHQQLIRVQEQITALPELDFQKFPTTYTEKPRRNLVISVMEEFKYFIFLCFLVATFWILGYFVLKKSLWRTFDENQPNS